MRPVSEHELDLAEDEEPLLILDPDEPPDSDSDSFHSRPGPQLRFHPTLWQVKSPRHVILLLAFIKFAIVVSGMLLLVPLARLIEDIFCHAYYEDSSAEIIEEMKCKKDEIQSQMAYLGGWSGLLNSVIGLVVAFPYGMMADKFGRKPTLIFSFTGVAISFGFGPLMMRKMQYQIRENPYLLMMGSAFQVLGGGIQVLLATIYAIAADVSTEKDKASNFLYLTFGATAGGLLGPLMAGLLMERYGPWVPISIVLYTLPFIFFLLIFLPETLTINLKKQGDAADEPDLATFKDHMAHGLKELKQSVKILHNKSVLLVLVTFFVQNARFTAYTSTIGQYVSKNFKWKLAETSLLLSPLGLLNLVILGVLPKVSEILLSPRFRMTPFGKDLFLTKVSTCILVLGAVIQGLSHNVVLFLLGLFISTFGAADSPLARATVTHYVAPEFTSRLYALIGIVEVVGSFIGGPLLAWFFAKGMKMGGFWVGMPWFYVGFLCCLAWVALLFVKPPKKHQPEDPTDTDDTDDYMPDNPLRLQ
ncbi:Fc.00g049930.m01.CDS01 [Cosmosporella sp. VM-42]